MKARTRMLTLDDIADLRAYERDRDAYRRQVIDLKRRRRVQVGPIVSLLFENRETMRSQVQEMARRRAHGDRRADPDGARHLQRPHPRAR